MISEVSETQLPRVTRRGMLQMSKNIKLFFHDNSFIIFNSKA
jgi:hypothetical protein